LRLWWFVFVFVFFYLAFVSGSKAKIKVSSLGKWRLFVSFNDGFGQFFICFFLDFRSQVYSTPLLFSRHAPLSHVLHRCLLLLPEALVILVFGVRRVACTRQRAYCFLTRVIATLGHFMAVLDGDGGYGG
jgi:hypothetical protein